MATEYDAALRPDVMSLENPRPLAEIAVAMEAEFGDGDPEASHAEADDLLVEALARLAPYATETADEGEAARIIAAYQNVSRWFA